MVWWRIAFRGTSDRGYQVMTPALELIGIFDDAGNRITAPVEYTTIDTGENPTVGVEPPKWSATVNA